MIEDEKNIGDEKICIGMGLVSKEYLRRQSKVKMFSFIFNEDIDYEEMGFGKEKITCLGIVNAANSRLRTGMGGLNLDITLWVRNKDGIICDQHEEEEWCNLKMLNRLQRSDLKRVGLVAVIDFNNSHIFHVEGSQACLVGTSNLVKNMFQVTEILIKAYEECLSQAKKK